MKIGVIISTYNSTTWLEKVLVGYSCQDYKNFEIVVADDGSGAETGELVSQFKSKTDLAVKHVWHEDDGFRKWIIVNRAILECDADYLLFTDGDCIPHPTLLSVHAKHAEKGRFLSGGYCRLSMNTSKAIDSEDITSGRVFSLSWLVRHGFGVNLKWFKVIAPGTLLEGILNQLTPAKKTFNGNNSSCFKEDVLRVNGFDERIFYGGGDREFGYRLENANVAPKVIRYSTLCLHLDHSRGYRDEKIRNENLRIISDTLKSRKTGTDFGIKSTSRIS